MVEVLDMFCIGTQAARAVYHHRSSQVKTPTEGLDVTIQFLKGDWQAELLQAIEDTIYDSISLK